jgi:hypothetical protein
LDSDPAYAERLAQRLAAADRRFSVTARAPAKDGPPPAETADGSPFGDAYDFVILGEAVAEDFGGGAEDFGDARRVILSESARTPSDAHGCLCADRYGRASGLVALLRAEYAARPGRGGFSCGFAGGAVKYVGCFGIGGGCGASSIAIGIGRDFAAYKGKRTLYVSLETLEATGLCMRAAEGARHIGDFLYLMLRGRDADLRLFAESCLFRDGYGLARFFPSPGLNDLARASPEECGEFLRFLDGCGFDLIVLDLGGECREPILNAVRLCDALVVVANGNLVDAGKRARATELLRTAWGRDDAEPVFATNLLRPAYAFDEAPDGIAMAGADASLADDAAIRINRDDASFRQVDGMTDFVLSGEFGMGVRKLTDLLSVRICE